MFELYRYQSDQGTEPLTEWLAGLRDRMVQARLRLRLKRLEAGNFGDCESVGEGVLELREHFGPGYRIYCGRHGKQVVILLCGGDKRTQMRDIDQAKRYWQDWQRRQA